ncbi:MAG: efflux RND transporter periplasmic adaptor subunit [bacterium]
MKKVIQMLKNKRKIVLIACLILVAIAVSVSVLRKRHVGDDKYRKVSVTTGSIQVTVLSTGFVQPENRLEIKAPVSGRIEQVLVVEGQRVKKGQNLVIISSTERAALLDGARVGGEAELKKWQDYYKPVPVFAPIDGTVILRNFEPGQTFTTSDSLLVMSDRLSVKAQVDETDISQIKLRQKADIVLDAYPDTKTPAHVDHITPDAKTINSVTTYIVDVIPNVTPKYMLSGMTANVTFFIKDKEGVLLVPAEAVKNKDGYFYVIMEDPSSSSNTIEKTIEVGISDGKNVEVLSGISKGDVVLIPKLQAGNKKTNPFSPLRKKS